MTTNDLLTLIQRAENLIQNAYTKSYPKKILIKASRYLQYIVRHLEHLANEFWSLDSNLQKREQIIKDHSEYLRRIVEIAKTLWRHDVINENTVISLARPLGWLGAFNECVELLEGTIGTNEDYFTYATLADIYFEIGLLDKSLENLEKIKKMGFRFYEVYYNLALTLYMIGEDLKAWETIEESEKLFKDKKPLYGLKIAVAIANNELELANRIVLERRGLI